MNTCIRILLVFSSVLINNLVRSQKTEVVIPQLDHVWWGPEELRWKNDTSIRPFQVEFRPEMIKDLRHRLLNHRPFTPPLEGVAFEYGFNTDYLHSWVHYWANKYDFKKRERFLNKYPQFKTNIQGLDIHFLWVKQKVPRNVTVIPLLLLHGFLGSVREFYETLPLLTAPSKDRDFVVEVIAPSIPGLGFSDGAVRPGLGCTEMGVILRNLMHRLGFKQFYVQGGDWGSYIGMSMATMYPKEVLGYHSNTAISMHIRTIALWLVGELKPTLIMDHDVVDRMYPVLEYVLWLINESGYFHIQATKPDSVGVAMADSPIGLLAYLFQVISSVTRRENVRKPDGGLDDVYTREELLDNLMLYWVPNCFTTGARMYAETVNLRNFRMGIAALPTIVPTWTLHAKHEITYMSPIMLKVKYKNLLHSTVLPGGGHFIALEEPEIFAEDVLKSLVAFQNWHSKY